MDEFDKPKHEDELSKQRYYGDSIDAYSTLDERNEEFAAEFTADDINANLMEDSDENHIDSVDENFAWFGWLAVGLAIVSFMWMPVFLGTGAIVLGIVARQRSATILGNIAIVGGALAIVTQLFMRPFL